MVKPKTLNLEHQFTERYYRTGKAKTQNSKTRNTKPEKVPPDHIDCFTKKNIYITARHVEMRMASLSETKKTINDVI